MLVSEKNMSEGDGIIISDPLEALGYQSAGAFQRLGRRMIGFIKESGDLNRLKYVPMQNTIFDCFLFE